MIEILSSLGHATVQDRGRDGYRRYGVGTAGAMDNVALAVGNILLGNPDDAAAIEIPLFPFRARFLQSVAFAIAGADCFADIDGREVLPWWADHAEAGQVLTLRPPLRGARCYLALAGGIDVPLVLGSRSTQLRGGFGGYNGRNLSPGDVLRVGSKGQGEVVRFGVEPPPLSLPVEPQDGAPRNLTCVRVLPAAEYGVFRDLQRAFHEIDWKISAQSNRYGYRLDGPPLKFDIHVEKRSHGIVPGVIQVPPGGLPIIQLRDAQTSGGYPKIATVIEADLWRIGQARLGDRLRFVGTSYDAAVAALDRTASYLDKLRSLATLYRALN